MHLTIHPQEKEYMIQLKKFHADNVTLQVSVLVPLIGCYLVLICFVLWQMTTNPAPNISLMSRDISLEVFRLNLRDVRDRLFMEHIAIK